MFALVTGGSASGKSEYAENLSVKVNRGKMAYIATMYPYDDECQKKIERHQSMRAEKDFTTIECPYGLSDYIESLIAFDTVLLECLSNLIANEMYISGKSEEEVLNTVLSAIEKVSKKVENFIIVSNEIFSELSNYDEFTTRYIRTMGKLNQRIAALSDTAIEVVCSIPIINKGKEEIENYENIY